MLSDHALLQTQGPVCLSKNLDPPAETKSQVRRWKPEPGQPASSLDCKEAPRAGASVFPEDTGPSRVCSLVSLVGRSPAAQVPWLLRKNNPPEAQAAQPCEVISSSRARGHLVNDFTQVLEMVPQCTGKANLIHLPWMSRSFLENCSFMVDQAQPQCGWQSLWASHVDRDLSLSCLSHAFSSGKR